jgi:hypothetical protein
MEKKIYNILWIDDEHDGMSGFKGNAKLNDIILLPFKSLNKGISELKKNYTIFDGVLLDAKFFENEDDNKGSEDTEFVHRAKEQLIQLPKKFEIFVLTAQAEAFDDKTFNKAFKKVYRKGIEEDVERLFLDIKSAADQMPDTQIRHEFSRVFEVFTEKYIGSNGNKDLLSILRKENIEKPFENDNIYFLPLRQIMEDIFKAFNQFGFLPDIFVKPEVAFSESADFLAGKIEKGYQLFSPIFPNIITKYFDNILKVCNPAAHRSEIDAFIRERNSSYSLLSTTYQMLDVLLWIKDFFDQNPNFSENTKKYRLIDNDSNANIVHGIVQQDSSNNYNCEGILIPYKLITEFELKIGDQIRIINPANNLNDRNKEQYKHFAKTIEKI